MKQLSVARVASHHYLLPTGIVSLALVMSRERFDSLPPQAQTIIRKYSGDWSATRYNDWSDRATADIIARLKADPRRSVTVPSAADIERAEAVYKIAINDWASQSPHNRELLSKVEAEIARLREARQAPADNLK